MIFKKALTASAFAKINLFLDIESKRTDGYHNIKSIMQSVSLCDTVSVELTQETDTMKLECSNPALPCDEKNLANKAALAFKKATGMSFGTIIKIEKNIPFAAGLGGGSSDAAAVLNLLNSLTASPLSKEGLIDVAAKIGADIPFCLFPGTAKVNGIGEKLEPIARCPKAYIVIAIKGEGVSTPKAYASLDEKYSNFEEYKNIESSQKLQNILKALSQGSLDRVCQNLYNIFEPTVSEAHPDISILKSALLEGGALAAMMSGSGPSVFGIFNSSCLAKSSANRLSSLGARAFVCETR